MFKLKRRIQRLAIKYYFPRVKINFDSENSENNLNYYSNQICIFINEFETINNDFSNELKLINNNNNKVFYLEKQLNELLRSEEKLLITKYYENLINRGFVIPNPDYLSENYISSLIVENEGESKKIYKINDEYNVAILKPTIFSFKKQRGAEVEGSDLTRLSMTKNILLILEQYCINHSYIYVGKNRILTKYIKHSNIPPVEVIVKRCFVGTDKHRYHKLEEALVRKNINLQFKNNNENDLVKSNDGIRVVNSNYFNQYPDIFVRFDYRNPNMVDGKPKGDECLYDDLADYLIDTKQARLLARYTFLVLNYHFTLMGIYFQDICFIITSDGLMHFYEISQDCGRYKKINEHELSDFDKDVWRSGGSSELVLEKWKEMSLILSNYIVKAIN